MGFSPHPLKTAGSHPSTDSITICSRQNAMLTFESAQSNGEVCRCKKTRKMEEVPGRVRVFLKGRRLRLPLQLESTGGHAETLGSYKGTQPPAARIPGKVAALGDTSELFDCGPN
jgi:hypothetical protein